MSEAPRAWWRAPLARVGAWREQRALERRAIPDDLWRLTLARLPFVARLDDADQSELRRLCSLFLDRKEFHGVGGLEVTDDMALVIAAQACLPVLRLGLDVYASFVTILVHPEGAVAPRSEVDEDGIVHEWDDEIVGEVGHVGRLMLAWSDVQDGTELIDAVYNVVIHEFVHAIDAATGAFDGVPPLPDRAARDHWIAVMDAAYDQFCQDVDDGYDTVVDPYGAEAVEEFFAVAVEAFFIEPMALRHESPALYELFAGYFQQDPAAR
jgi:Mlc titration factor MtfA (ptsG expression regulator)